MLKRLAAACVLALSLGVAVQAVPPPTESFFCLPWFECPPCPFNLCW